MKRLRKYALLLVVLCSTTFISAAYTPRTVPNPKVQGQAQYVANPDNILNADDVQFLNHCAQTLYDKTQAELCIVVLESINNADAFHFAYELFQIWGIGVKGKNTGVLVLFVLDSHDIRIMTGTGIEGVLTDARCAQIIRDDMTPAFRENDYGGGLCRGVLRIYETCTDGVAPEELLNMKSVTNRGGFASESNDENSWAGFIILLIFLVVIIYAIWKSAGSSSGGTGYRGGGYSGGYGGGYSGGGFGGGSWGGGSTSGGGAGGKW